MLKSKAFKACLLIPAIVFCLNSNGFSKCPPDCPQDLSTTQGDVTFSGDWHCKWDSTNTPVEIADGGNVDLYVTGCEGPYSMAVSGHEGFYLVANKLYNNGACGTATITVIDASGKKVTGQVRSTYNSDWYQVGGIPNCGLRGAPDSPVLGEYIPSYGYTAKKTDGGRRQTETIVNVSTGSGCDETCNPSDCDCNNAQYTAEGGGCAPCLSLPSKFNNSSYSCGATIYPAPLYAGTFYCKDYTTDNCPYGNCGGSIPKHGYSCYASSEQKYEEWQCNP